MLFCPTIAPTESFTTAKGTTAKTTAKLTNEEQAVHEWLRRDKIFFHLLL
jgi:hypothetical protein